MIIRFNGNNRDVPDGVRLLEWLVSEGVLRPDIPPRRQGVAVERNREVVPASQLAEVRLAEGDELEVVTAFPGG